MLKIEVMDVRVLLEVMGTQDRGYGCSDVHRGYLKRLWVFIRLWVLMRLFTEVMGLWIFIEVIGTQEVMEVHEVVGTH